MLLFPPTFPGNLLAVILILKSWDEKLVKCFHYSKQTGHGMKGNGRDFTQHLTELFSQLALLNYHHRGHFGGVD